MLTTRNAVPIQSSNELNFLSRRAFPARLNENSSYSNSCASLHPMARGELELHIKSRDSESRLKTTEQLSFHGNLFMTPLTSSPTRTGPSRDDSAFLFSEPIFPDGTFTR